MTASSRGAGEGTTFKVVLPLMSVHHVPTEADLTDLLKPTPAVHSHLSLKDIRVLVVDDEPDARDLITAVLAGRGAEVVAVDSAADALGELARQRFNVLVSDVGMPKMDGYALIEKIRQLPAERGGTIPAAALTAYAGVQDLYALAASGLPVAHRETGRAWRVSNDSGESCWAIERDFSRWCSGGG